MHLAVAISLLCFLTIFGSSDSIKCYNDTVNKTDPSSSNDTFNVNQTLIECAQNETKCGKLLIDVGRYNNRSEVRECVESPNKFCHSRSNITICVFCDDRDGCNGSRSSVSSVIVLISTVVISRVFYMQY